VNKISLIAEETLNILKNCTQDTSFENITEVNVPQKLLSSNQPLQRSLELYCPLLTLTS